MMWWFVRSMSILRMVGSMLAAMQANKSAKSIIQQQADTDDNADSDYDFMMDCTELIELDGKRLTAESGSIEYSLGKYRMINGEIYRQKATTAIKSICVVRSNTWWYTIRNRRCILWQQKLQM